MKYRLAVLGTLLGVMLYADPVQVTISLSGGNFDRGVTSAGSDTGTGFLTASAACTGAGCALISSLDNLNNDTFGFTVPSGSNNGAGSVLTGSLLPFLTGFFFEGQSAFSQNSELTENVGASGILGDVGSLTGTLTLTWIGNSAAVARSATGTITLSGDIARVAAVPEPSTALMLLLSMAGLVAIHGYRRRRCGAAPVD